MKQNEITILKCDIGQKIISGWYHHHKDDDNNKKEKEEFPHPDLMNSVAALETDMADACWVKGKEKDKFVPKGFTIDEGDGISTIDIRGTMENRHGYTTRISTGKIPFESEKLIEKVDKIRTELFNYFFDGKCAQGKLEGFGGNGGNPEPDRKIPDEDGGL